MNCGVKKHAHGHGDSKLAQCVWPVWVLPHLDLIWRRSGWRSSAPQKAASDCVCGHPGQPSPLCPSCLCLKRRLRLQTTTAWRRPRSQAGLQLSSLLYLMTSPDWWFEAEQERSFLWAPARPRANPAERDGPENTIHLDVKFVHDSGWRVPPWKSVPEHKCFKMHHVESQSDRKMHTIPSSETNYRSFNEGVLRLEKKCRWPRTWWVMLAARDQACVASCFTSLARPESSSRRLERGRAHLELITHSRTVQDSDLIAWCEAVRALLLSWVRTWKWAWWWYWFWLS